MLIYLGTFSKYISPSINVGYILLKENILKTIYSFKESFDLCMSLIKEKYGTFDNYLLQEYDMTEEEQQDFAGAVEFIRSF